MMPLNVDTHISSTKIALHCDSGIITLAKKGKITFTNLGNIL